MPRGGLRPGAGRKKGSINKFARETREAAAKTGMLPHEILLKVARGGSHLGHKPSFDEAMQAAAQAAPFYAPKIAAIEHSGNIGRSHEESLDELE